MVEFNIRANGRGTVSGSLGRVYIGSNCRGVQPGYLAGCVAWSLCGVCIVWLGHLARVCHWTQSTRGSSGGFYIRCVFSIDDSSSIIRVTWWGLHPGLLCIKLWTSYSASFTPALLGSLSYSNLSRSSCRFARYSFVIYSANFRLYI